MNLSRVNAFCRCWHSGFTMIELMVAISIIVVLTAIAIPNYRKYHQSLMGARCSANLKSLWSAVIAYSAAHPGETERPEMSSLTYYVLNKKVITACPLNGLEYQLKGERMKPVCMNGRQDYATDVAEGHYIPGETN